MNLTHEEDTTVLTPESIRATVEDRSMRRQQAVGEERHRVQMSGPNATAAREQATQSRDEPVARRVTEDAKRPTITLQSGAVVDAREAVSLWYRIDALLTVAPEHFRSLLALAEGRIGNADSSHFEHLLADGFLEDDRRTIRQVVQEVIRNSYQDTKEGPVISPLRLQSEDDHPVAEQALREIDRWVNDIRSGRDDNDRSPD